VCWQVLSEYASAGGVWGILDPATASDHGATASHYLAGNGTRTVVITMSQQELSAAHRLAHSRSPPKVVFCEAGYCRAAAAGGKGRQKVPTRMATLGSGGPSLRHVESVDDHVTGWFGFELKE
jgi:hypothetical protein